MLKKGKLMEILGAVCNGELDASTVHKMEQANLMLFSIVDRLNEKMGSTYTKNDLLRMSVQEFLVLCMQNNITVSAHVPSNSYSGR